MVVLENVFFKALFIPICWKKWRGAWLRWPTSTTLRARPCAFQQRAVKGRLPARLGPQVTWLPQSCTRSSWGGSWLFSHLRCCLQHKHCTRAVFCVIDSQVLSLLAWMWRVAVTRFATHNATLLRPLWEESWQCGPSSAKCLESKWKALN